MSYTVQVKAIAGWTHHSTHDSYRDAVDQADMVRGRVLCSTGLPDEDAWKHAVRNQGFEGDYAAWSAMDDDERTAFEVGADPAGTKMKTYTINSECGPMYDIQAESIDDAKDIYSREKHYDFDLDEPGSWYSIWEDGVPVEQVGNCP